MRDRPDYPRKAFASLDEARAWTQQFVRWYNYEHKHSGLKFVTPAQRHNGVANAVLAQREIVYARAKASNPRRWSCSTRNWELKDEVWLNPERAPRAFKAVRVKRRANYVDKHRGAPSIRPWGWSQRSPTISQ